MRNMSILLGKALRTAREQRHLTQGQLAKKIGVSRPAVGQWEAGDNEPSTAHLIKACEILGLDINVATGGLAQENGGAPAALPGFREERPEFREVDRSALASRDLPKDVPVFGVAAAGADADFYTNGEIVDFVRRPPGIMRAKEAYALYVVGTSMVPRFEEGELIYVNPSRPPAIGDYVIVELVPDPGDRNGRGYIKRLAKKTLTKIYCEQFNQLKMLEFSTIKIKSLHRVLPWNELLGI